MISSTPLGDVLLVMSDCDFNAIVRCEDGTDPSWLHESEEYVCLVLVN